MNKIKIEKLNLYYGDFHALKDINLEIREKQITSFIGPSGCGKSTLLKSLNRMNDMVEGCRIEGKIILRDKDLILTKNGQEENLSLLNSINILDKSTDVNNLRKNVGMVFQKPNPFPMSIYDNIAYGPRTHGIKKRSELDQIVEESLRNAAIWEEFKDKLKKSALELSGGQQQRLCIARTLAVQPDVILLDEPTSALDPISTSKIEDCLLQLKDKYTVVIVTHNMQQAVRISDRTVFFLLGEIIEEGETQELFSRPKMKKTEDYITGRFG
ncbi:MAG: ATP-binding cassette domain-containing protein [Treponema sp.]|nr:ATP-binding cassette domain-containing protein [Treponema sp.]